MRLSTAATVVLTLGYFYGYSHATYVWGGTGVTEAVLDETLIDQEGDQFGDEDPGSGSGIGVDQNSEYQWIMHSKSGDLHVANSAEIEELLEYIAAHNVNRKPGDTLVSQAPTQLEDGPTKVVDESEKPRRISPTEGSARPEVVGEILEEVTSTNFYPQYGVGILENSCTAFLIGPRHALTTANCVYSYYTNRWNNDLDFWRGRRGDEYLAKMHWDHVVIPAKFFVTGSHIHNWALVAFTQDSASPVWLKIAYSSKVRDKAMTVYGYLPNDRPWGTMYSTVCRSDSIQSNAKCLAIQCGTSQKFSGGPLLKGYNFQRSKMPLVYGISVSFEYSYSHTAVNFHPNFFWSLCHFMKKDGFDAKCGSPQE